MTATNPSPHPTKRWQQLNTWAGYLIFGFPALAAVPALIATTAKFGIGDTLLSAGLPALLSCTPVLLWNRYTRRHPGTYSGRITWAITATLALGALAFSPLFFWAGPAVLVVLSEFLRHLAGPRLASLFTAIRGRRHALDTRRAQ